MQQKRILLILGHPSGESFCAAIAERYQEAARAAGHEVRDGKYRVYTRETVEQLVFIKCAQQLGFRLKEMQEIFQRGDELSRWDLVRQAIAAKKQELHRRIEELQRHYNGLEDFERSLLDSTALCDLERLPGMA